MSCFQFLLVLFSTTGACSVALQSGDPAELQSHVGIPQMVRVPTFWCRLCYGSLHNIVSPFGNSNFGRPLPRVFLDSAVQPITNHCRVSSLHGPQWHDSRQFRGCPRRQTCSWCSVVAPAPPTGFHNPLIWDVIRLMQVSTVIITTAFLLLLLFVTTEILIFLPF